MKRHRLTLLGEPRGEVHVPAETLLDAAGALLEGAVRAVRFAVQGESVRPGPCPAWLDATCRLEITAMHSGSTTGEVDAPALAAACPDRFGPGAQGNLFGEPDKPIDGRQTAVDLFGRVLSSALAGDPQQLLADRTLLETCIRLAHAAPPVYEGIQIDGIAGPVIVRVADVPTVEKLRDELPRPYPGRVTGILDATSASGTELTLRLPDGAPVSCRLERPDLDVLRHLSGKRVVISGLARFRASRELLLVEVKYIGPARKTDAMWEKMPAPRPGPGTPVFRPEPQDEHTGVNAIFGTWPGDETDEELLAALKEIR